MAEQTVEDYVASLAGPVRDVVDALVDVIDAALPDAECQVWDGSPVWRLGLPGTLALCAVTAHHGHVAFGVFRGHEVADRSGRLDTRPGRLAHVRLHTTADLDADLFTDWLHQARDAELFTDWLRQASSPAASAAAA